MLWQTMKESLQEYETLPQHNSRMLTRIKEGNNACPYSKFSYTCYTDTVVEELIYTNIQKEHNIMIITANETKTKISNSDSDRSTYRNKYHSIKSLTTLISD